MFWRLGFEEEWERRVMMRMIGGLILMRMVMEFLLRLRFDDIIMCVR